MADHRVIGTLKYKTTTGHSIENGLVIHIVHERNASICTFETDK